MIPSINPTPRVGAAAVRERLRAAGRRSRANDNIARFLQPGDLEAIQGEAALHLQRLLDCLCIDTDNDHNTRETADRLAKLYCREVFAGRFQQAPPVTSFPNAEQLGHLLVVGPITLRSTCSHHFAPILGSAWVGVLPGARVIGLSKFHRLADWVFSRPQIQEEATVQYAQALAEEIDPRGLAVLVRARHSCCSWRGVQDPASLMTTSHFRGDLQAPEARREFLEHVAQQGAAA